MSLSLVKQLFVSLPYPQQSFAGKIVIVTGSNTGLGKEAARHIARLGATSLILAVRSLEKGEAAKEYIKCSPGCSQCDIQVWQLDMANSQSVLKFVERAERELERVDVLIANAAVATMNFAIMEGNETTLTVNVISTFLLVLSMLPKMKDTAKRFGSKPVISITSSGAHTSATFAEKSAPEGKIFATMNDNKNFDVMQRYPTSKLLEVFCVKQIGEQHPEMPVTINEVDPGFCHSDLAREITGMLAWVFWFNKLLFARSTEYGSRTLVHAASQGPESHGQYLSDGAIAQRGGLVKGEDGKVLQQRVWKEVSDQLEKIKPGVLDNL